MPPNKRKNTNISGKSGVGSEKPSKLAKQIEAVKTNIPNHPAFSEGAEKMIPETHRQHNTCKR